MDPKVIPFSEAMRRIGVSSVSGVPGQSDLTNQLMMEMIKQQKIANAMAGLGVDARQYQVWIEPGTVATKIAEVQTGEVVVLKLMNDDAMNARTIYFGWDHSLRPNQDEGLGFPLTVIGATNLNLDFSEDLLATTITAVVAAAQYTSGDALAVAIQAAMNAISGSTAYHVTFLPTTREIRINSDGSAPGGATLDLPLLTGPSGPAGTNTSIATTIGLLVTDRAGSLNYYSDNPLVVSSRNEGQAMVGHPLYAGCYELVVCETSLYGILDPSEKLRVPLSVRRQTPVGR